MALLKRKSQPPEKSIDFYDLVAALGKSGCAICRRVHESARSAIDSLLYESVTDPIIRGELRMTQGFCQLHARMAVANGDAFGLSIIYQDLVADRLAVLARRDLPFPETTRQCLICQLAAETEKYTVSTCRKFFDDHQFRGAIFDADAFCGEHFVLLLDNLPKGEARERLWQWEQERLATLHHQLAEFIRKGDYRFHHESVSEKEADAWQRALAWFAGKPRGS